MKNRKAARPDLSRRYSNTANMVLVPHDKVGAGFMRNVVFPLIAVLGVGSAGYFGFELWQQRQQTSQTAQAQADRLLAAQDHLAQLQRRTNVREAQFEASIHGLEQRLVESEATVEALITTLESAPKPVGDAVMRPGGINIRALDVAALDQNAGEPGQAYRVELTVHRESQLHAPRPLAHAAAALVNLTWESAPIIQGKLRLVALPQDERDGKRVYLPGKAWRRSNGFDIDLAPGAEQVIIGDLMLPAKFEPAHLRVEIFSNNDDGGYTMLRRVYRWPGE